MNPLYSQYLASSNQHSLDTRERRILIDIRFSFHQLTLPAHFSAAHWMKAPPPLKLGTNESASQTSRTPMRVEEAQRGLVLHGMQLGLRTPPWAYFSIRAMLNAAVAAKSDRIRAGNSCELKSAMLPNLSHAGLTQKVSADLFQWLSPEPCVGGAAKESRSEREAFF